MKKIDTVFKTEKRSWDDLFWYDYNNNNNMVYHNTYMPISDTLGHIKRVIFVELARYNEDMKYKQL